MGKCPSRIAQEAAHKGNATEMYRLTRKLSNKVYLPKRPVKNKKGELIMKRNGKLARWKEYFEEVLNPKGNENLTLQNIERLEEVNIIADKKIKTNPPSKSEIFKALKDLTLRKAPGLGSVNPEILKADVDTTATVLLPLFGHIWETEKLPDDWKEGPLVKIPKKVIYLNVRTGEELHCYQSQAKFLLEYYQTE
jgi:hypothetical protein